MRQRWTLFLAISILWAGISCGAISANAAPGDVQKELVYVNENTVVLVDLVNNRVELADLINRRFASLSKNNDRILDVSVLKSPQKIVLLQQQKDKKIRKTIFSYTASLIGESVIPLKIAESTTVKWAAPTGKVNERIMVQNSNNFSLYQYPWRKPVATYNATIKDNGYESISVQDWDFVGYPNLAIKYQAQGIMSNDHFVKTVNLYSKKETLLQNFNTDFQLKFTGSDLALFTSYVYQAVPAHVNRPDAASAQQVYRRINMDTGKETASLTQIFTDQTEPAGWQTEYINDQIFVGNLGEQTWSLYSKEGRQLVAGQIWPKKNNSQFLGYRNSSMTAYFLDNSTGQATIIVVPVQ
ncbi:hypothetical protein [Paenibacillus tepidiphilus]|uniref:hypothetical protein n=1 Tax=Paenibacillus tepidiphilus TaxID=2608683 RepID=UPI001239DD5D|nr:hypothetical protein [Paenibacillus tepidiphilus]